MIERGGHKFEGYDKPIRTPNHPSGKSHAVVVKVDGCLLYTSDAADE